ncbi:MAG: hypothetical protein HY770_05975 [Chitinivibrionia bacterium]|nr:hypothetical protein [Chitinivibrionia bacterium]
MTNQNGEFVFAQLQPGNYSLWVDQKSIGLGNIATTALPIEVGVEGGKTTVQEIGVSSACKISGTVALYTFESGKSINVVSTAQGSNMFLAGAGSAKSQFSEADLIETGSVSQILIEISNGTEMLRQLTDDKGQFSFEGIRPGEWNLRAYDHNVPQHHYIEEESIQIGLVKGDEKMIKVRVLPYIRTIRMLEGRIVK